MNKKIRLCHISDTHIEEGDRLEELESIFDFFISEVERLKVDAVLHSGDWWHKSSTPKERLIAASLVQRLTEVTTVLGVDGNHDAKKDVEILNRLETKKPIQIYQKPDFVFSPGLVPQSIAIVAMPWVDKPYIKEWAAGLQFPDEAPIEEKFAAFLSGRQQDVKKAKEAGAIPIFIGHVMAVGSIVSSGQDIRGTPIEVRLQTILEIGCAYSALGHVHNTQDWFDGTVCYSGSPMRHNLGEPEEKGFRLIEIEMDTAGNCKVRNDFVPLPAKKIELVNIDLTAETNIEDIEKWACFANPDFQNKIVRVRCLLAPEDREKVNKSEIENMISKHGASKAVVEISTAHTETVRSEKVLTATTTRGKLEAMWEAKGMEIDEKTREQIWIDLGDIESSDADFFQG